MADKSLHTNLQDLSIFTTRINVETFGFITSPISFEGTGLGLQFDHGFTSVRPVQPPSSAVGSPVLGYAGPPSYLTYARSNFKTLLGLPVVAKPTPLVPQYVPAWPPARPSVYRPSLYRPLSHLTYARLTSLT